MTEANGTPKQDRSMQLAPAVEEQMRKVAQKVGLSLEDYLKELAKIAGMPVEDYLKELAEEDLPGRPTAQEKAILRWTSRTEEQILADREAVLKTSRKARPLPEGKTLDDVVCGLWPGDETDEEINKWLEELS